jgi:multidrug efflux pump subunit AcrB
VPDLWYQVRKKVGDIRQTLPQGIVGPFFNDEFGDTYGIIYGFTADGFSHRELRDYAEEARSRLLRVKDVSKAEFLGTQDERIYVEFSTHRLAELGMDRMELVQALVTQNAVVPSGVIQTKNEAVLMDVTGRFESEKDLQQVNFVFGGKMLRLGDIATITRGYADPPQPKFRVNGKDAIGVALSMRTGGDILALEKNLDHVMEELKADLPVGIETFLVSNQPKVVEEAVNEFMKALWEAIAIVLVISFLNLGLRAGLVVATSIPLVLAIVFIVMQIFGIDLQRISLGALIIALGLLVDDAMITIEAMVSKVEHGWDSIKAAIFAYASTAYPRLTGTLVIALGFVPVGFAKSSAGEYTFTLFAGRRDRRPYFLDRRRALHAAHRDDAPKAPKAGGQGRGQGPPREWRAPPQTLSAPAARHDASRQTDAGGDDRDFRHLAVARAVCAQPVLSRVGPAGARARSAPAARRLDLCIGYGIAKARRNPRRDPDIVHWSSYVGRGAIRFYLPLDVQLQNDFFAQTIIVTKSLKVRDQVKKRLEAALQEKFPEAVGRVFPLELGPPVGWPVQYRLSGSDPHQVRELADKLAGIVGASPDIQRVAFNWMDPIRKLGSASTRMRRGNWGSARRPSPR